MNPITDRMNGPVDVFLGTGNWLRRGYIVWIIVQQKRLG
jgi:hypothetical protein